MFVPVYNMKKNDFKLIGLVLIVALAGFFVMNFTKNTGSFVRVSVDGTVVKTFSLSEDITYTISGYHGGSNELVIKNNEAYLIDADCPDLVCVKTGHIKNVGESIVCLPHKVVVEVINEGEEAEIDSVSQ